VEKCLYLISAVLQVVGIAWVVSDLRADFASVRGMLATQPQAEGATSNVTADNAIVAEVVAFLSGKGWRRLVGPGLVVAGVAVGLAASVAAL
jgi:hypothetical protein